MTNSDNSKQQSNEGIFADSKKSPIKPIDDSERDNQNGCPKVWTRETQKEESKTLWEILKTYFN